MKLVCFLLLILFVAAAPVRIELTADRTVISASVAEAGVKSKFFKLSVVYLFGKAVKYAGKRAGQAAIVKLRSYIADPAIRNMARAYIAEAAIGYVNDHPEARQKVEEAVLNLGLSFANLRSCARTGNDDDCTSDEKEECPPCKTVSGRIVSVGTIGFRFDKVPPGRPHYPFPGDHYNLYKANQAPPQSCRCFWQSTGAVGPYSLPPGAIPIEPFAR